jgi:PleD family two-component response regulator
LSDRRAYIDAARLFSRLVRNIDFACREQDGSILAAFTETDLRSAHVVARRIASVLRHTMLSPGRDRRSIKPTITLATLKPTDNLSTLVARVGAYPKVAGD